MLILTTRDSLSRALCLDARFILDVCVSCVGTRIFLYKGCAFQFKAVAIQRLAACSLHAESMHGLLDSIRHYFQSGPAHLDSMTMRLI